MRKKNLFNLDAELFSIQEEINENGGELTPELEERLEITTIGREQKIAGCLYIARELRNKANFVRAEAKRLQEIAKQYDNTADRLEENVLTSIINIGPVKTDFMSVTTRRTKAVHIVDDKEIPEEFCRVKYEPNKTAIKEAIENGMEVPGAEIVENQSLLVR